MSPTPLAVTAAQHYDRALCYATTKHLNADARMPEPTCRWPEENIRLLEHYVHWRISGGGNERTTFLLYLPAAGHVLGLALKPHPQLDLMEDFEAARQFILAKGLGKDWTGLNLTAIDTFRRYLRTQRGLPDFRPRGDVAAGPDITGLPDWLVRELTYDCLIRQRNWRKARLCENITRYWSGALRVWRYFVDTCGVRELSDLKRNHLFGYLEQRMELGKSPAAINNDLRNLRSFLLFLEEQGHAIPQSVLKMPSLKQPDRLPRFLTDSEVLKMRADLEKRVQNAPNLAKKRDFLLDRAVFYLPLRLRSVPVWQGGLRLGELEELRLEDLHFAGNRLSVRNGKGMKDRTIYLTGSLIRVLSAYLAVRGAGTDGHVFLYRNRPLKRSLAYSRIRDCGRRVGVKASPHKLRHTNATQLLNAGCPVTSIQRLLGHKKLNTTMVYARAHDTTVAEDYFAAMRRVEGK